VRDFNDPFFAGALEALAVEAMEHGYNVLLGHIQGRQQDGLALPAVLEPRLCDAVLVLGDMEDQPQLVTGLLGAHEPVVACWQGGSPIRFPTVDVDDHEGVAAGLAHLVELGHSRIGFVAARLPGGNLTREEVYTAFITERFGGVPTDYLQRCENTLAGGEAALGTLLSLPDRPTAVACATDVAAVGVLHGAHALGVAVPDQLSVIGYDDLMFAPYTVPALTTMRMPTAEIVETAVRMAIGLARGTSTASGPSRTVFEPTLIVRSSTGPLGSRASPRQPT